MSSLIRHLALEGNIRVLALQTLVSQLGFGMMYVVWQPYILSTGLTVARLGVIQTVINLSTSLGLFLWGSLSDRLGRRPIILASNLMRVLGILALIVSGSYIWLLVFAFFVGFSALFMQSNPARSALISESVEGPRRATAYSTLMSISQITNTAMASAGGYIAVVAGYKLIFYVTMAVDVLGLAMMATFLRETHVPAPMERSRVTEKLGSLLAPEGEVLELYAIMAFIGFGYSTAYSLFNGALTDSYGFNPFQLGLLGTSFSLVWGLSSVPMGRLADRLGRKRSMMVAWFFATITAIGYILFRSFWAILLLNGISALDPSIWIPSYVSLVSERLGAENRSRVMGKLDAYARFAGMPSPWLAGVLYNGYGFAAPLLVQLACLLIWGALLLRLREA